MTAQTNDEPAPGRQKPVQYGMRPTGLMIFFILLPLVLLPCLVWLVALEIPGEATAFWTLPVQLLLVAMVAGALGAYMHAVTSFTSFLGNRTLRESWTAWYYMRPLMGAVLAVIFYFLIRGGFLMLGGGTSADLNVNGIAAMAGLVGMFSKQATDKMRELFDSLFKASGDEQRGDKLGEQRLVTVEMIRRSETLAWELEDDREETLRNLKLVDLKHKLNDQITRIPVFGPGDTFRCMLHKSLIDGAIADAALNKRDLQEVSIGDLLDDPKRRSAICDTIAFVPPVATIVEARSAMLHREGCQDVFVTEGGERDGKVLGWLTDGVIARAGER